MYRFVLSWITMLGSLNTTLFRTRKASMYTGYVEGLKNMFHNRRIVFNASPTIRKMMMIIRAHQALHN